MIAGQVEAKTPIFFNNHSKVKKTALYKVVQTGKMPTFPMLSGTVASNPAAQQAARPTNVYRTYLSGSEEYLNEDLKSKYECEYDVYGHITSLRLYEWNSHSGTYILSGYRVCEYLQLPNSKFVKTKDEYEEYDSYGDCAEKRRYTSSYDSKGMLLRAKYEYFDLDQSVWNDVEEIETVLNNGVRTAIKYNGNVDNRFSFDEKGRISLYKEDDDNWLAYTWNDADRPVEVVENLKDDSDGDGLPDDVIVAKMYNIQIVHNEKYFDPYSLTPLEIENDISIYPDSKISWGDFAVDDNTLHSFYYNADASADINGVTLHAQKRTVVSSDKSQITETTTNDGDTVQITKTYILDGYGSYRKTYDEIEGDYYEISATYSKYGELTRQYIYMPNYGIEYEGIYNREYDNQKRPVKTTFSENIPILSAYEETYDAWTNVDLADIDALPILSSSVFIDPAAETIVIDNIIAGTVIKVTDLSGRSIYQQIATGEREKLPGVSLAKGVYIVTVQTGDCKTVKKIIKQ